jgi:hypothetical protein
MRNNKKNKNGKTIKEIKSTQTIQGISNKNNIVNIQHVEINKLIMPHKKIRYCPLISKILNKNNRKLKKPIIYSFLEYLSFHEKIQIRTTCKQWNDIVKEKLPFLTQENFINCVMRKSVNNYVGRPSKDSNNTNKSTGVLGTYKKTNRKSLSNISMNSTGVGNSNLNNNVPFMLNGMNSKTENFCFENSDKKFSKKKVLVKLINSKNFNTIKNKVILGEMTQSRNLLN